MSVNLFGYPAIVLASASPRRAELLDQIGVNYRIHAVDIDESRHENEPAEALVQRLALEKAQAYVQQTQDCSRPVLGADTLGVLAGELLVKPRDYEHALAMLQSMSGRWHEIYSAVAICYHDINTVRLSRNRVLFRPISVAEIRAYWETQEPCDKAGAYAIQGQGAAFIERIEGSYSGIMGLPLFETTQLLGEISTPAT